MRTKEKKTADLSYAALGRDDKVVELLRPCIQWTNRNLPKTTCHRDRRSHGPAAHPRLKEKRLCPVKALFLSTVALSFVIPERPGFLLHSSQKRHLCGSPEREPHAAGGAATPDRNPGKPRDLQFRGPLLETRNLATPQICHLDRSVAQWRDLQFLLVLSRLSSPIPHPIQEAQFSRAS